MKNDDSLQLLKECDSGTKMAVSSIDEVLDNVKNDSFRNLLTESREHHEKLGNRIQSLLKESHSESQEPGAMAKSMSWLKTNMKLTMNPSDHTIADLMTDGCNMGIKSLHRYLNEYKDADHETTDICNRLISIEETLCKDLQEYL